jgi:hypothetical protein
LNKQDSFKSGHLTKRHKLFCQEFLKDCNATQAAVRSGYSKKTARKQASRLLLTNVDIQFEISAAIQARMALKVAPDGKLNAKRPELKLISLAPNIRELKEEIVSLLNTTYGTPYLDDKGRFCVSGGLHQPPILDRLLELGASHEEIEKHIYPIGTSTQWRRWQEIKMNLKAVNQSIKTSNHA